MLSRRLLLLPCCAVLLSAVAGCRIVTHKNGSGNDNVDIGTPFGSMQVKTDNKPGGADTGLTPYPGAQLVKKDKDEGGAADINMSFGNFKLGVHAVDLKTQDPEDKVLAFYRNDLQRYGDVLTCRGEKPVGTPVRTSDGLTCGSNQKSVYVHDAAADHLELRAGSPRQQHIVGIHTEDGATRIELVALDLPGAFTHHDASDRE